MALRLISAQERLAADYDKTTGVIFGRAKVGKTSLAMTLPEGWLFTDMEAGMKSLNRSAIGSVPIETFEDAINLACIVGGPDLSVGPEQRYSVAHYEHLLKQYAAYRFETYIGSYWDSITDLTRLAVKFAERQPDAYNKFGVRDTRAIYGTVGREVVRLLKHVQRARGKSCFFVGGLDHYWAEGREVYSPQMEGNKAGNELPFIVDQIITMSDFDFVGGLPQHNIGKGLHRALCCTSPNPWGLPAGDRSGNLEMIEEPHLGKLLAKINRRG